jgi:cytochrome b pre-mRNA-processing protein 3
MGIKALFGTDRSGAAARALYEAIVTQARLPGFYRDRGVPDTLDGRFDMIVLHAFLVLHRLKRDGHAQGPVGQALFDLMFADMDASLREIGVGDLSVGKKVKQMARAFYGRAAAYDAALADGAAAALEDALRRNLYGTVAAPDRADLAAMAGYVRFQAQALAAQDVKAILAGRLRFAPPELPA